jgi:UDP-glucose 4-epimerase
MSRVLVTGGAGAIGGAIVRRLLADPAYEVRVSDRRAAPQWMREGAELHGGDLRIVREARAALDGCTHVIHLAGLDEDAHNEECSVEGSLEGGSVKGGVESSVKRGVKGGVESSVKRGVRGGVESSVEEGVAAGERHTRPFTLMDGAIATCSAVIGAAVERGAKVERFVYVSSAAVFERGRKFPTSEAYLPECPTPGSAYGFAMLAGEMYCRAAYEEHGLQYTICRPFDAYGPGIGPPATLDASRARKGMPIRESANALNALIASALSGETELRMAGTDEQTRTPTHVDDIASGVIAAMGSPKGINEDFNVAAKRELTVAEIARIVWETCGEDQSPFATKPRPTDTVKAQRSWPSVEKARRLLGWEARIEAEEGIAATVEWIRAQGSVGSAI